MTTTPATEIEPVLAGALQLLRDKPDTTLETLAAQVAPDLQRVPAPEAQQFPPLPKHVELTDEVKRALKRLPDMFNSVEPETRRSLAQTELDLLTLEQSVISMIGAALLARQEAIKETIRHHMDVAAEEKGLAVAADKTDPATGTVIVPATPRDQNGHYLLAGPKDPHQVQAGPVLWSQEYSAPTPKANDGALQTAFRDGSVTREEYLAVSRETRVLDQEKTRAYIRKNPERGLAILRRVTVGGKPKSSLYIREVS
jgi:hypothetical protein